MLKAAKPFSSQGRIDMLRLSTCSVFAILLAATAPILSPGIALADDPSCRTDTFANILTDTRRALGENVVKTLANGLLVVEAFKGGSTVVKVGSTLLLSIEMLDLWRNGSQAAQMPDASNDPNRRMQVCTADSPLAAQLGFKTLKVVADPGVADRIARQQQSTPPAADDVAWRQVLEALSHPPPLPAVSPPSPLPRTVPPAAAPPPEAIPALNELPETTALFGHVVDAATGRAAGGGTVRLTAAGTSGAGLWQNVLIDSDGSFFVNLPPDKYVLSFAVPGYQVFSRSVLIAPGGRDQTINITLQHQPSYPCPFTMVNRTGWTIQLYMGNNGPPELIAPWSNREFTLNTGFMIAPVASFMDHAPVQWPPIRAACNGPGYAFLDP